MEKEKKLYNSNLENKYLNNNLHKKDYPKMTLIIGIKYKEGVVLIGDTKISEGTNFYHDKKIVRPIENLHVVVGCAGYTQLAKEFNTKINLLIQQRTSEIRLANIRELNGTNTDILDIESGKIKHIILPYDYKAINLLDDCATLTNQIASSGKVYSPNPIESLISLLVSDGQTILYQIDCNGFKIEVPYASIGSGTDHIGDYLKKNYYEDITLKESILLGTFLIKYVECLDFDRNVGLEKGKLPQVYLLKKDFVGEYELPIEEKINILNDVKKRIKTIRKSMILFNNKGKQINKPVWGKSKRI